MKAVAGALAALALGAAGATQEAPNTPAATQPAAGRFYLRERLQWIRLEDDPLGAVDRLDRVVSKTSLAYGLSRSWSAELAVPLEHEDRGAGGSDSGVADLSLQAKWRAWQEDLGPVDSLRFAFLGGAELPSGDDPFTSDSVDPFVGGVFTAILGRHGANVAVRHKWNGGDPRPYGEVGDGDADATFYDLAYLFRLSPAVYAADTAAATYLTVEFNGIHESNGDHELLLRPGVLYEARDFALELTIGIPAVRDVDARMRREWTVEVGFRVLF